ncbi:MAG TPA: MOSC N-terminal beta barrel domain-containing protein [Blastocatellia bacterium]|nr:MOSC N-terminal beta barrel domain-containing protein [Blastocatellia bacterium]
MQEIGIVKAIYRYPVKSMAGEQLTSAALGWHGIKGDRRFAFRRVGQDGGFPWLSAGRLPSLIRYQPYRVATGSGTEDADPLPTHVRTPAGEELELRSEALRQELSAAHGAEVEIMHLKHGTFDEAALSLITTATLRAIEGITGLGMDPRRFRPNILVDTATDASFLEDEWLGKIIAFGEGADAPAMSVAIRDVRCGMLNLDPDTGSVTPQILKAVVSTNQNCAGIYGATFRSGTITVGTRVFLKDV